MPVASTSLPHSLTLAHLNRTVLWGALLTASLSLVASCAPPIPVSDDGPAVHAGLPYDPESLDSNVQFHKGRVERDPAGAIGWSLLASAYLDRAKESDDARDAQLAEQAARYSLKIRERGNIDACLMLASALMEQHRFRDALDVTRFGLKLAPNHLGSRRMLIDILVELGDYDEARAEMAKVPNFDDPSGWALQSRFLMLGGNQEEAIKLLAVAAQEATEIHGQPAPKVAWYWVELGKANWLAGRPEAAREHYEYALEIYPRSYKARLGLARIAAGSGHWEKAKAEANLALGIAESIEARSILVDCLIASGNRVEADKLRDEALEISTKPGPIVGLTIKQGPGSSARLVESVATESTHSSDGHAAHTHSAGTSGHDHDHDHGHNHKHEHDQMPAVPAPLHGPGQNEKHTHSRQIAMFIADHSGDLDEAWHLAEEDLKGRDDWGAHEACAWILSLRGDGARAAEHAEQAILHGIKDARLYFHAGMAFFKAGRRDEARKWLSAALAQSPEFHHRKARIARETLKILGPGNP